MPTPFNNNTGGFGGGSGKPLTGFQTGKNYFGINKNGPLFDDPDYSKYYDLPETSNSGIFNNMLSAAGSVAGIAKSIYNAAASDLYTADVNDDYEKLAYNSIYGSSNQDPLQRMGAIFQTNSERMQPAINAVESLVQDYSDYENTNDLAEAYYNNSLHNINPLSTEKFGKDNWKFAAPLATAVTGLAGVTPLTTTALALTPLTATSKRGRDFNQSTLQGALAGTQYGGLGWGTLAGATLGSLANVFTNIGAESRTNMYNRALENAQLRDALSFDETLTSNAKRKIRDSQLNQYQMAEGGSLEEQNGVTKFNTGSSHENNPYGGIQQGIASDNLPNMVEEGELKYNDYIYSNRLKPSKSLLKQYNLPEKYAGKTFAEIGDKLQKESEERPNDPISKTTLDEWMLRLQNAQEDYKAKAEERRLAKVVNNMSDEEKAALLSSLEQPMAQQEGIDLSQPMYAKGGKIHIKPSKRGTFTAAAKKHGKSVQAFASQVLANKENYSPAMVKKANFARNAAKWHKHDGLSDTQYLNIGFPWPTYQTTGAPRVDYSLTPREELILAASNPATTFGKLTQLRDNLEVDNLKAQQDLNLALLNDKMQKANLGITIGDWQLKPDKSFNAPLLTEDKSSPVKVKAITSKDNDNTDRRFDGSMLRYAPAVGAGLGALTAMFQPIDYRYADELRKLSSQYKGVSAPHIGGYRSYNLYDVNLGDAENLALQAQALAANRGQNRATQAAANVATISRFQEANAKRNLAAQQANEANRLAVDTYNLGIDQFNAQRDSQYDQLNADINNRRLAMLSAAAQAADASRTAWANNISSTTENYFNQLGNVGKDQWVRNQRDALLTALGAEGIKELMKSAEGRAWLAQNGYYNS